MKILILALLSSSVLQAMNSWQVDNVLQPTAPSISDLLMENDALKTTLREEISDKLLTAINENDRERLKNLLADLKNTKKYNPIEAKYIGFLALTKLQNVNTEPKLSESQLIEFEPTQEVKTKTVKPRTLILTAIDKNNFKQIGLVAIPTLVILGILTLISK